GVLQFKREEPAGDDNGAKPGITDGDFRIGQTARQNQVQFTFKQRRFHMIGDAVFHLLQVILGFFVLALAERHLGIQVVGLGLFFHIVGIGHALQERLGGGVVLGQDVQFDQAIRGLLAGLGLGITGVVLQAFKAHAGRLIIFHVLIGVALREQDLARGVGIEIRFVQEDVEGEL